MKIVNILKDWFTDSSVKWKKILLITFIAGIFLYWSLKFNDTDLYYIIPTGRYILSNGIPKTNPFVTTEGLNIVVQNWLYCTVVAWVYNCFSSFGLWLLQSLQLLLMFLLILYFLGWKDSKSKETLLMEALIVICVFGYQNLRPEMLTFSLILLELIGLEEYEKNKKFLWLLLLPATTLIEINAHASYWVMHFVVLLPYIAASLLRMPYGVKKELEKIVTISVMMTTMAAVLFINPYGVKAITYVFDSVISGIVSFSKISEQQSASLESWYSLIFFIFTYLFIKEIKEKAITFESFYMYLGMGILLLTAIKWVAFYSIGVLFILRDLNKKVCLIDIEKAKIPRILTLLLISTIAGCSVNYVYSSKKIFALSGDEYMNNSCFSSEIIEIANILESEDKEKGVYVVFEKENYFEFRGFKVYYDARPELFSERISDNSEIANNIFELSSGYNSFGLKNSDDSSTDYAIEYSEYASFVDGLEIGYYIVPVNQQPLFLYLNSSPKKYKKTYIGETYCLFEKV